MKPYTKRLEGSTNVCANRIKMTTDKDGKFYHTAHYWEVFFSEKRSSVRCVLQSRHNQSQSWKKTHFQDSSKIILPINPSLIKLPSISSVYLCCLVFHPILFTYHPLSFHLRCVFLPLCLFYSTTVPSLWPPPSTLLSDLHNLPPLWSPQSSHLSGLHHRPISLIPTTSHLSDLHNRPISLTSTIAHLSDTHNRPISLPSTIAHLSDIHIRPISLASTNTPSLWSPQPPISPWPPPSPLLSDIQNLQSLWLPPSPLLS